MGPCICKEQCSRSSDGDLLAAGTVLLGERYHQKGRFGLQWLQSRGARNASIMLTSSEHRVLQFTWFKIGCKRPRSCFRQPLVTSDALGRCLQTSIYKHEVSNRPAVFNVLRSGIPSGVLSTVLKNCVYIS